MSFWRAWSERGEWGAHAIGIDWKLVGYPPRHVSHGGAELASGGKCLHFFGNCYLGLICLWRVSKSIWMLFHPRIAWWFDPNEVLIAMTLILLICSLKFQSFYRGSIYRLELGEKRLISFITWLESKFHAVNELSRTAENLCLFSCIVLSKECFSRSRSLILLTRASWLKLNFQQVSRLEPVITLWKPSRSATQT